MKIMTPNKIKLKDSMVIRKEQTNTTIFILPLFKVPLLKLEEYGFVDSYLYDKYKEDTEPDGKTIYVLFRPRTEEEKGKLEKQIEDWENNKFLIEDYDYAGGYVVVALRFPDKYRNQYKLFRQGRYSEFSKEFQEELPRKVQFFDEDNRLLEEDSLQFMIINKRVKLKNYWRDILEIELDPEDEYWGKINLEKETMDIMTINTERLNKEN